MVRVAPGKILDRLTELFDWSNHKYSQKPKYRQYKNKNKGEITSNRDVGRFPNFPVDMLQRQIDLDGAQPLPGAMDWGGQEKSPRAVLLENPVYNGIFFIRLQVPGAGASTNPVCPT
jgi:hypothetical protein